jgi:hypothetical protein
MTAIDYIHATPGLKTERWIQRWTYCVSLCMGSSFLW